MLAVGIMSGTSLDGVDCALISIEGFSTNTKVKAIDFISVDMPKDIKEKIKICCDDTKSSVSLICSLNFELGKLFGESVLKLFEKAKINPRDVDFIASHGQTIYHIPHDINGLSKSTLQIGDASVIAEITGVKVVSNFRERDMAVGGTGAPLVPYVDYILFSEKGKNIALNNIGGISNVTVLPSSGQSEDVYAFDTGAGNMIIDEVCNILFDVAYDKNGDIARKGTINQEMLEYMLDSNYLKKAPPKATGREDFGEVYTKNLLEKYHNIDKYDLVTTVTAFTAKSITKAYKDFIKEPLDRIIFCGGGAYNKTLIGMIKEELQNVFILEDFNMSSDAKEAIQFAVLGNECINNQFANLPKVTGASKQVVLGRITNG